MNATVASRMGRVSAVPASAGGRRPELRLVIGGKAHDTPAAVMRPSGHAVMRPNHGAALRPNSGAVVGPSRGAASRPGHGQRLRRAGPAGRAPAARHGANPAGGRPAPLRLTRRGRLVVTSTVVLLIGMASLAAATAAKAAGHGARPAAGGHQIVKIMVQPGQTLWSIAREQDPGTDPRAVIAQISQLNSLPGFGVMPGQVLWVPRG